MKWDGERRGAVGWGGVGLILVGEGGVRSGSHHPKKDGQIQLHENGLSADCLGDVHGDEECRGYSKPEEPFPRQLF